MSFRKIPSSRRSLLGCAAKALALATGLVAAPWAAAAFPSNPIKLVVPFSPGGATDTIARQLATEMTKQLGQPVIVDNRPGASGNLGVMVVVNAPADGHTLLLVSNAQIAADPTQEKMPYVPTRDLTPIAPLVSIPYVVAASNSFGPNSIQELIAAAKKSPGTINFASSGTGTTPHMASELMVAMAGIKVTHVPYKGAVPALTDLVGGQVQFMTGDINAAMPFLQGGRIKALATTGRERAELLPNVPTVAESGLPGYETEGWFAVLAPAKVPPDIVAALQKAIATASQQPDFKKRMGTLGGRVLNMQPAEFQRFIASETAARSKLIKSNKIVLGE